VIESGVPSFDVSSWNGIAAPAGVPPAIIAKLSKAVSEALESPDAQAAGRKLGMVIARQFAGRTGGSSQVRHCQMVGPDREGSHSEARVIVRPTGWPSPMALREAC
jgi:hypothetical protein